MTKGKLVLIIGPSGVGKSVILKTLKDNHPELHFPRSATTRSKRKGEGDELYCFISDEEFDELIANDKVLEWAVVHGEERYGTLEDEIIPFIEDGKIVIREVDVQGFNSISNHRLFKGEGADYKLDTIFILPESKDILIQRIKDRAPISDEELMRRIESMDEEMIYAQRCGYQVVNAEGKLEDAVSDIEGILGL